MPLHRMAATNWQTIAWQFLRMVMYLRYLAMVYCIRPLMDTFLPSPVVYDESIPISETLYDKDGIEHDGIDPPFVPEGHVFVQEWRKKDKTLCRVAYGGDEYPSLTSPFVGPPAKAPWIWIGDNDTEISFTMELEKFIVPGNVIRRELLAKLVHVTPASRIQMILPGLELVDFPSNGVVIEADDSVPNS